jgi:hypothetical protein
LTNAVVFGNNGIGGTSTVYWAALDGDLIEWCLGDGAEFSSIGNDVFAVWQREQELWNEVESQTGE